VKSSNLKPASRLAPGRIGECDMPAGRRGPLRQETNQKLGISPVGYE